MGYNPLFLFVEGEHDKLFFESIIIPKLVDRYTYTKIIVKATARNLSEVNKLVTICTNQQYDYWRINDFDDSQCITEKKEAVRRKHPDIPVGNILIVCAEIESWYAAGLDSTSQRALRVRFTKAPDSMTKQDFYACIPQTYRSRVAFLQAILHHYSFEQARKTSISFNYCMNKLGI